MLKAPLLTISDVIRLNVSLNEPMGNLQIPTVRAGEHNGRISACDLDKFNHVYFSDLIRRTHIATNGGGTWTYAGPLVRRVCLLACVHRVLSAIEVSMVLCAGLMFSPWRILDDFGGAFAMGAIGGSVWHGVRGFRTSPKVRAVGCF